MNKDDTIELLNHATEVKNDHIRTILVSLIKGEINAPLLGRENFYDSIDDMCATTPQEEVDSLYGEMDIIMRQAEWEVMTEEEQEEMIGDVNMSPERLLKVASNVLMEAARLTMQIKSSNA